jgi:hypothetical protein
MGFLRCPVSEVSNTASTKVGSDDAAQACDLTGVGKGIFVHTGIRLESWGRNLYVNDRSVWCLTWEVRVIAVIGLISFRTAQNMRLEVVSLPGRSAVLGAALVHWGCYVWGRQSGKRTQYCDFEKELPSVGSMQMRAADAPV